MPIQLGSAYGKIVFDSSGAQKGAGDAKNALSGLKSVTSPLKGSFTELNSALGLARQGLAAVKTIANETIGKWVTYALKIDDAKRVTGMTAEETSRLVQVMDDLRISQETLSSAMEYSIRQGYKPSKEWLMQMADKIAAIPDPTDRAAEAIKLFGKQSGPDMARLLEQGSAGLDEWMTSIDGSMVVTEAGIAKAKEYYAAIDDLGDAWTGLKNNASQVVLPIVLDIVQRANSALSFSEINNQLILGSASLEDYQNGFKDIQGDLFSVESLMYAVSGETSRYGRIIRDLDLDNLTEAEFKTLKLNIAIYGSIEAYADHVRKLQAIPPELDAASRGYYMMAQAEEAARAQTAGLSEETGNASVVYEDFAGKLQSINSYARDYTESAKDIASAEADLAELRAAGWGEHSQKVMDAKAKIEELQAAQKLQTDMWMLDVLTQKLATDGLTDAEMAYLLQYQVDTGIITAEAAIRAQATWDEATARAEALNSVPTEGYYDFYIRTHGQLPTFAQMSSQSWSEINMQAEGGDWLVTKPTLFMAGEAGPERATFTPMGKSGSQGRDAPVRQLIINFPSGIILDRSSVSHLAQMLIPEIDRENIRTGRA